MTYQASFQNHNLAIEESKDKWLWKVTNRDTAESVAEGECPDRESAMVAAAEAAKADWGSAKWRRPGETED